MKALFSFIAIFSFSFNILSAQDCSIPSRLIDLNAEWNTQGRNSSQNIPPVADLNEMELIQFHLSFVEKELRGRSVTHLSALQRKNRSKTLDLLSNYWKAGTFPQNIYHSERTPYFIDHLGTHCAVGYLMMKTGFEDVAQKIHEENNYAYVSKLQLHYPELEQWAELFGFQVKELAWIQPNYAPICWDTWCVYSIKVFVNDGTGQPASNYDYEWSSTDLNQHILEELCPNTIHSVNVYDSLGVLVSPDHVKIIANGVISGNTVTLWDNNYTKFELDYNYAPNCQSVVQIIPRYEDGQAPNFDYSLGWNDLNFEPGEPLLIDSLCDGWHYIFAHTGAWECSYHDSIFISPDNGYDFLNFSGDSLCFDQCFNITPPESNAEVLILLSDQYGNFGVDDENAILINSGNYQACLPHGLEYSSQYRIKLLSEDETYNNIEIPTSIGLDVSYTTTSDSGFLNGELNISTSDEFEINSYHLGYMEQEAPLWNQLFGGEYFLRIDYDQKCTYIDTIEIPINLPASDDLNLMGDTLCAGECFSTSEVNNMINNLARTTYIFLSDPTGDFGEDLTKSILIGVSGADYTEFNACIPPGMVASDSYKILFKPYQSMQIIEYATIVDVVIQNIAPELTSTPDINQLCSGSAEISFESDSLITSIDWSSGETELVADSLCAGWYSVNTYFGDGCVVTDSVQVMSELSPEITLISVSTETICEDECFEVAYESIGFSEETEFICELSDELGSFVNPIELSGSLSSVSGVIPVCYLNNTSDGSGYRIRVKSIDGSFMSAASTSELTINHIDFNVLSEAGELSVATEESDPELQWLECETNEELAGETDLIFNNGQNGLEYAVILTSNGCSKTSECVIFEDIEDNVLELTQSVLNIYPNPAHDFIRIKSTKPILKVTMTDPLGRLVLELEYLEKNTDVILNLPESISDGVYYVSIESGSAMFSQKLCVNR